MLKLPLQHSKYIQRTKTLCLVVDEDKHKYYSGYFWGKNIKTLNWLKVKKLKVEECLLNVVSNLETFNLQPSTFNFQPSTFNLQPSTFNFQPSTFNLQLSTFNLQPSTFNLQLSTFLKYPEGIHSSLQKDAQSTPEAANSILSDYDAKKEWRGTS
jgi:hypothetical protein